MSPYNKSDGTFGNCVVVQEQKNGLGILRFDILRVPPIQIPTKKFWTLSFLDKILLYIKQNESIPYYQYVASLVFGVRSGVPIFLDNPKIRLPYKMFIENILILLAHLCLSSGWACRLMFFTLWQFLCPLRTPVPRDRLSHLSARWKGLSL
jgi:hypothetical protein